jgi:hypothetical protein
MSLEKMLVFCPENIGRDDSLKTYSPISFKIAETMNEIDFFGSWPIVNGRTYPWLLDNPKSLCKCGSIAPWNTAADAEIIHTSSRNGTRDSEDMPRKAIDMHLHRLTIHAAGMDRNRPFFVMCGIMIFR